MSRTAYDAFVSYRWTDPEKTWVREELVPRLRASGLSVCLDVDDFVPGRDLILEMERAGIQSKHILCVITPRYFDGNRMVHFESLAARRRDPSGQISALIPLVLQPTEMPEWIRGLIPIDWTSQNRLDTEWTKLLRILGGDERVTPPPFVVQSTDATTQRSESCHKLEAIDVVSLSPRTGTGFGWDIILANISNEPVVIDTAAIFGEYSARIAGLMSEISKMEFEIVLDAKAVSELAQLDIRGSIFEGGSSDWGRKCSGKLRHEFSTAAGHDMWTYSLVLPLYTSVPPSQRHVLRLAFKPDSKITTKAVRRGHTPAYSRMGVLKSTHTIELSKSARKILSLRVASEFLEFISKIESSAQ